jgi:3-vinyl bacteriochlorophyllide hydratase
MRDVEETMAPALQGVAGLGYPAGEPLATGKHGLYTAAERARRDATIWTLVQGVLAPLQFVVFLISLALVLRYLATGTGEGLATASIVVKTLVLYTIMVTGSIWEKEVFGQWLFAPAFFWEDVVSMGVIALHTLYLAALVLGWFGPTGQMVLALVAYAIYVVNAAQFLWKLRMARLQAEAADAANEPMRLAEHAQ